MSYAPLNGFIAPAKPTSELWRTVVGFVAAYGLAIFLSSLIAPSIEGPVICERGNETFECYSTAQTLTILYAFGFIAIGVVIATRFIHGRAPLTLLGDLTQLRRDFWIATKALLWLTIALAVIPSGPPVEDATARFVPNVPFSLWLLLLPVSLCAVLVQTSAEEILFRGYLTQQLAARLSSPMVWMGLPAIVFAVGHYSPSIHGESAWMVALWAGVFALVATDLTARTGNLGAAMAFHFINNVKGILLVSLPNETGGLSLFTILAEPTEIEMTGIQLAIELGFLGVSWLAIRVGLRR
ncbi:MULTISPECIES: CPBP family intramembrane glutamic endopeptidase [Halocynthiibacter]|uniref:CPBP family intramembrane metalloprotease n=1 Tax=Halocynthiibacter halioticoli TaxID=2986804 RepID=A0AAE3J4M0_9RHOB|nr:MULTISPECIES: type II CAAX endopeptidase family protein [Halocynthiibacter]MCV6825872.1 CPBP family intramembrane metalloprotease [Halocynthiibacter halioticoli]MCW4058873.1 CPBP family intramembrane metalloprotease [Halocynthiibacter sp. SDUM655004]